MYANQFIYSRERRRFGRQCMFSDRNEFLFSIQPRTKLRMKYLLRNPQDAATQLSSTKALSVMCTENVSFEHRGLNHYEGAWPKEVNIHDEEATLRHRKKIEREDSWGIQVASLITSTMEKAEQNNSVNIYQEFFSELPPHLGGDIFQSFQSRPIQVFHDLWHPARTLISSDWVQSDSDYFTALHINNANPSKKLTRIEGGTDSKSTNAFYMWDRLDPLETVKVFDSPQLVTRAYICRKDENFMAGGYQSGMVITWNGITGGMPLLTCPLEAAHREEVSSLIWVHSKSNTEFYTGSLDSSIKFWDNRDLVMPLQELLLEPDPKANQIRRDAHGVTVMEFEYTIPVRFIMCSDMGYVFLGNRKGMSPTDVILGAFPLFKGPIRTIQRNPTFVKSFLICADWCARFWAEECKGSPITLYFRRRNQVMCGAWSPTRCSLFVIGDSKGFLEFWDLLLNHRHPIYTLRFAHPIMSISIRGDGEFAVVALANGDSYVLEMDYAMKMANSKEKALIAAMFEREILRSKYLEARIEEIKMKQREASIAEQLRISKAAAESENPPLEFDPNDPNLFMQLIENDEEFRKGLQNFQDTVMNVEKQRTERQNFMERTDFEQYYLDNIDVPEQDTNY